MRFRLAATEGLTTAQLVQTAVKMQICSCSTLTMHVLGHQLDIQDSHMCLLFF